MDSLTNQWHNLSLDEREGGKLSIKKNRATLEYTIATKFLTTRVLNTEPIVRTFNPLWQSRNGFKVKEAGEHIRLFVFDNVEKVDKIMASEPWSFDRHLVILHRLENAILVHEVAFNTVSLWVQVHNIPISFLNRKVAEELCKAVGVVDRNSKDGEVDGGSFIRVQVRVDITVPLCRGWVLSIEDEEEHWVSFKYERIPNICYWCGCLDHFNRDCDKWIDNEGTLRSSNKKYRPGIRASTPQIRCKLVVVVPGFYEARKKGGSWMSRLVEKKVVPLSKEARVQDSHANQRMEKEMEVAEAQIVETFNAPEVTSLKPTESLKGDINGNKGDFMEKQIREIDM